MLDTNRFYEWQKRADGRDLMEVLNVEEDIKPLAEECLEMGSGVLLIKCGAPGIFYRSADRIRLKQAGTKMGLNAENWANLEGFERSYVPDRVLSGTGGWRYQYCGFPDGSPEWL